MRAARPLCAAILAVALFGAPAAHAADVSSDELTELSAQAGSDPASLDRLLDVTSVDGRPADVAAALEGASGEELQARVDQLARSAAAAPDGDLPDAATARADAQRVLTDPTQQPPQEEEGDSADGGFSFFGLPLPLAIALVVLALAGGAVLANRGAARRIAESRPRGQADHAEDPLDPRNLERRAQEADARGEYAEAVRLRFRAGLLRLGALRAIRLRPSLTAAGAARELGSEELAGLAGDYEEITFGGREAREQDSERQRSGWRQVISKAGKR